MMSANTGRKEPVGKGELCKWRIHGVANEGSDKANLGKACRRVPRPL